MEAAVGLASTTPRRKKPKKHLPTLLITILHTAFLSEETHLRGTDWDRLSSPARLSGVGGVNSGRRRVCARASVCAGKR